MITIHEWVRRLKKLDACLNALEACASRLEGMELFARQQGAPVTAEACGDDARTARAALAKARGEA